MLAFGDTQYVFRFIKIKKKIVIQYGNRGGAVVTTYIIRSPESEQVVICLRKYRQVGFRLCLQAEWQWVSCSPRKQSARIKRITN